jgi:hypothetical protein
VRVLRDAQRANISLLFGQVDRQSGRWAAIADGAFVRVDDEQRLMEFRFANLQMVSGESDIGGPPWKLLGTAAAYAGAHHRTGPRTHS